MKRKLIALALGLGLLVPALASAEVKDPLLQKLVDKGTLTSQEAEEVQGKTTWLKGLSIGATVFVDYSFGQTGGATKSNYNRFTLQRGYINIRKEITPWFKMRMTPDIKVSPSSQTGDYTVRMKYLYADFLTPDLGPVTDNDVRVGLGHTPFLDFEEGVNTYRMQSPMFQDKRSLITSSDLGVSVNGNFGGKLTREQVEEVGSASYAGRFGGYFIGVYNGGGYSSTGEQNQNKAIQGRVTVRLLPDALPGLQLTYYGITGKGNAANNPAWTNNTGFVSYQNKLWAATAEFMTGKGQINGADSNKKKGYSLFGRFTVPAYTKVAAFARYDSLDPDTTIANDRITTTIVGASYRIIGDNLLVAAYEKTHDKTKTEDDKKGQVVLQIAF